MSIAIVIVNYRTPELAIACAESLLREGDCARYKIVIGDAASNDGSSEKLRAFAAQKDLPNLICVDIDKNGGFAYGNNYLLRHHVLNDADITHVHFLNPDTYIREGAVSALANFLDIHPKAGIVGSRLEDPDGTYRAYGFRFPTPWREFFCAARLPGSGKFFPAHAIKIENLTTTREVDWVSGASFMMPRTAIDQIGMMDPEYFLYFEETDLMARAKKLGFEIWHVSDSAVVHLAGASTGMRTGDKPRRLPAYWFQSRYKYFRDHYGKFGAWCANALCIAGQYIYAAHRFLLRKPNMNPPHFVKDLMTHGYGVPNHTETKE